MYFISNWQISTVMQSLYSLCSPAARPAAHQPRYRYMGARCLELGSGPGLMGLMLAKMGAHVVITDKAPVLPLIAANIEFNGVGGPKKDGVGYAEAAEMEWGTPGDEKAAALLAAEPLDWVIAADCCYIDQVTRLSGCGCRPLKDVQSSCNGEASACQRACR